MIEWWDDEGLGSADPLRFPGYLDKLMQAEDQGDTVHTGRTSHYVLIRGNCEVLGGSMGVLHGERVVRGFDRAIELGLPVVVVTASGGARLQEGMVALVQMARTVAAARRHRDAGLLSLAVHTSPTTGGVFASYGSLCCLSAVVGGAIIGFAGPRVVEQTVGESVHGRSHTAGTAYAHGLVDAVLEPEEVAGWIEAALGVAAAPLAFPLRVAPQGRVPEGKGAWGEVQRARWMGRFTGIDVAAELCDSWVELRGTDPVIRAGLAVVGDRRVVVIANDRYSETGRPTPSGYRLAQRAMALAGDLGMPLLTLVDTPGAEPGPHAENDGIAREIARTFRALSGLRTPSVSVCVGEGGSGGALALAACDRLLIQEHAVFSVIGPEGAAAILERDATHAPGVAEDLMLTSGDLLRLGIVDAVAPEDMDGLRAAVVAALDEAKPGDGLRRFDAASVASLRRTKS